MLEILKLFVSVMPEEKVWIISLVIFHSRDQLFDYSDGVGH